MQIIAVDGLGAEITGVDIKNLSDSNFQKIQEAFAEHGVIFFRDQDTSEDDHIAFAERFGDININVHSFPNLIEVVSSLFVEVICLTRISFFVS